MKNNLKLALLSISFFLTQVTLALAAAGTPVTEGSVKLENPLKVGSIADLLSGILSIVITLSIPVIVYFIIYAGFLYVTARGNTTQIEQATKALTYAIIGGVIIIGAVTIAAIVKNMVSSF